MHAVGGLIELKAAWGEGGQQFEIIRVIGAIDNGIDQTGGGGSGGRGKNNAGGFIQTDGIGAIL